MSILPKGYKVPQKPSLYMSLRQGQNKFRILGAPILGYEGWTTIKTDDGAEKRQPIRHELLEQFTDGEVIQDAKNRIKHFWAMPVWNFADSRVQILEIVQTSIMEKLKALDDNEDWGDMTGYNIVITRTGENLLTEYEVMPSPKSDLDVNAKDAWVKVQNDGFDLKQLYTNGDPFKPGAPEVNDVKVEDIPF